MQNPQKYQCADDRPCDFHDVMIAQSLFGSSSFFGATCSRACPGVDTGEDMVDAGPCGANSTQIGVDKINLAGCRTECLADHRCNFMEHVTATSVCRLYADCAAAETADETADETETEIIWQRRAHARAPELACSGRGACGITGQCVCDLGAGTVDAPAHREKTILNSTARSSLTGVPITTLDTTAFRGENCEKICPGYDLTRKSMATVCNGHGICDRSGNCQCDVNWVGVNCELRCPVADTSVADDLSTCSGHGICYESRLQADADTVLDEEAYYMIAEAWRRWSISAISTRLNWITLCCRWATFSRAPSRPERCAAARIASTSARRPTI